MLLYFFLQKWAFFQTKKTGKSWVSLGDHKNKSISGIIAWQSGANFSHCPTTNRKSLVRSRPALWVCSDQCATFLFSNRALPSASIQPRRCCPLVVLHFLRNLAQSICFCFIFWSFLLAFFGTQKITCFEPTSQLSPQFKTNPILIRGVKKFHFNLSEDDAAGVFRICSRLFIATTLQCISVFGRGTYFICILLRDFRVLNQSAYLSHFNDGTPWRVAVAD